MPEPPVGASFFNKDREQARSYRSGAISRAQAQG